MAKMGRPALYGPKDIARIQTEFREYIETTDIPIVAEFAYKHHVSREALYQYDDFFTLLKDCTTKKEAALEALALKGDVNVTMAIFSLKQLGWTDKTQTELTGKDGGAIEIDTPRERIERRIAGIAERIGTKPDSEGNN